MARHLNLQLKPVECPECRLGRVWYNKLYDGFHPAVSDYAEEYRERAQNAEDFFKTSQGQKVIFFCDSCKYKQRKTLFWKIKNI